MWKKNSKNNQFVDELIYGFELLGYGITIQTQQELKSMLENSEITDNFPMISYEQTMESEFYSDISESNFLNSESYNNPWLICDNGDDVVFILSLSSKHSKLIIDVFEISTVYRNQGLSRLILNTLEEISKEFFNTIELSAFDSKSFDFWTHMGYIENNTQLIKIWKK